MLQENAKIAEFYDKLCEEHGGKSWKASHWADSQMQQDNFDFIIRNIGCMPRDNETVLDIGCGQASLFGELMRCQNTPYYHGIDISTNMIELAKKKYGIHTINKPGFLPYPAKMVLETADFFTKEFDKKYDWVIAIGAFNYKVQEDQQGMVEKAVEKMYNLANKGVTFTLLKKFTLQEQYPYLHSYDAAKMLDYCLKLTPYVNINHSHLPSEFAVLMYTEEYVNGNMVIV